MTIKNYSLDFYIINTVKSHHKMIKFLPSIAFSYSSTGSFIEQGVYGKACGLYFSFLIWEIGFTVNESLNY